MKMSEGDSGLMRILPQDPIAVFLKVVTVFKLKNRMFY